MLDVTYTLSYIVYKFVGYDATYKAVQCYMQPVQHMHIVIRNLNSLCIVLYVTYKTWVRYHE